MHKIILCIMLSIFFHSSASGEEIASDNTGKVIPQNASIIILHPNLKFEQINNESILDPSKYSGTRIDSLLVTEAKNAILKNNLQVKIIEDNGADAFVYRQINSELMPLSNKLAYGQVNGEALAILKRLSSRYNNFVILVHDLYAKVGPNGYWDPNTGAIASSLSTSRVRAALIRCSSGEVLWKKENYIREIPNYKGSKFIKFVKIIYDDLTNNNKEIK